MRHLVIPLESVSEELENFLYKQGLTVDTIAIDECIFDVVSYLITTDKKLALLPIVSILKIYFKVDPKDLLEISNTLRTSFYEELKTIDIQSVSNFVVQNRVMQIDGTFDYHW